MVLNKLSKSFATVATVGMMVANPMMAMAADSPTPNGDPTLEDLGSSVAYQKDEQGNITELSIPGSTADGLLNVQIQPGVTVWFVIDDGVWDSAYTTTTKNVEGENVIVPYVRADGEEFICDGGIVQTWTDGIVTDAEGAYFVVAGHIRRDLNTFAVYDETWFAIKNGTVDQSVTGPRTFEDFDGNEVTALFAAGRMLKEFTGVTDDPEGHHYEVEQGVIKRVID